LTFGPERQVDGNGRGGAAASGHRGRGAGWPGGGRRPQPDPLPGTVIRGTPTIGWPRDLVPRADEGRVGGLVPARFHAMLHQPGRPCAALGHWRRLSIGARAALYRSGWPAMRFGGQPLVAGAAPLGAVVKTVVVLDACRSSRHLARIVATDARP